MEKYKSSIRGSVIQITFILVLVVSLTLGTTPATNQFERNPIGTTVDLQSPQQPAAVTAPSGRSWVPTGDMGTARSDHTATLLSNGKVLVARGI